MADILKRILAVKAEEVARACQRHGLTVVGPVLYAIFAVVDGNEPTPGVDGVRRRMRRGIRYETYIPEDMPDPDPPGPERGES